MDGRPSRRGARPAPVLSRSAVDRGLDIVTTVKDSAAEVARKRRDPSHIAQRRRLAAKRRLAAWSISGLVLLGIGANGAASVAQGEATTTTIGATVLVAGLWVYCVVGSIQALRDLRDRNRAVRRLPPPAPDRRAVAGPIRPLVARLDAYSDALRHSVGMIGITETPGRPTRRSMADDSVQRLRNETLACADDAEARLRNKAAEYSALARGGSMRTPEVTQAQARLEHEIHDGVDEYGRLVAAASEAAGATRDLAGQVGSGGSGLPDLTDRLTALAIGMREITGRPGRTD